MTYYEAYSACKTEEEIKEKAIADTKVAILLGNNPDRIRAIENAMNRALAERGVMSEDDFYSKAERRTDGSNMQDK